MAILTLKGHISRALNFYNNHKTLYAAIGKSTKWVTGDCKELKDGVEEGRDYDLNPPFPSIDDEFLELIAFKKVESAFMVVQDDKNGTLEYRGTKWRIVNGETDDETRKNAYTEGSRWVYLSTTLNYNEISTTLPYRQVGIFSNIERVDGEDTSVVCPKDSKITCPIYSGTSSNDPAVLYPEDVKGVYILESELRAGLILTYEEDGYIRKTNDTESVIPNLQHVRIRINKLVDNDNKVTYEMEVIYVYDNGEEVVHSKGPIGDEEPVMYVPSATLEILDNRKPVYRDSDVREVIKVILEF